MAQIKQQRASAGPGGETAAVQPQLVSACAATSSSAASRVSAVASSSDATTAAATSAAAADLETPERGNKRLRPSVPTERFRPPSSNSHRCRKRAKVAGAAARATKQVDAAVQEIETGFASLRHLPERRAGEAQRAGTRVRLACLPACLPVCLNVCARVCARVCPSVCASIGACMPA
jgi:hypothetical protein